jgi:hypothetical protein
MAGRFNRAVKPAAPRNEESKTPEKPIESPEIIDRPVFDEDKIQPKPPEPTGASRPIIFLAGPRRPRRAKNPPQHPGPGRPRRLCQDRSSRGLAAGPIATSGINSRRSDTFRCRKGYTENRSVDLAEGHLIPLRF